MTNYFSYLDLLFTHLKAKKFSQIQEYNFWQRLFISFPHRLIIYEVMLMLSLISTLNKKRFSESFAKNLIECFL